MTNSKNGRNRRASAPSNRGTGSIISFNGGSDDRRKQLTSSTYPDREPANGGLPNTTPVSFNPARAILSDIECFADIDLSEVFRRVFETESRALQDVPRTLEPVALERIATALIGARRICCYATGSSRMLTSEAEYQFVRLGLRCISIHDCMQLAVQTTLLSPEDVVLAFSYTGRNRRTIEGLGLARRTGALTICVTSEPDSPLTKQSDISLILPKRNTMIHDTGSPSKIPELTLIRAIATYIAMRTSNQARTVTRCDELVAKVMVR